MPGVVHAGDKAGSHSRSALRPVLKDRGRGFFERVLSTDEAGACKPDPRPYRMALERADSLASEACMVAAHGWDILGADAVGMKTIWIERLEKRWPFPGAPPGRVAADLSQVPEAIDRLGT